jgi:NADH-quinone oxidoreductase subunit N
LILAQQTPDAATIEVAWSSFAPEVALSGTALVLLLLVVAGPRRALVATPVGLAVAALGVWFVTAGLTIPGAVAIVMGAGLVAVVTGFGAEPRLINPWVAALGALGALGLTAWQYLEVMTVEGTVQVATTMQGSVALDGIALFTRITVFTTILLVLPIGYGYLNDRAIHRPEYESLLLLSATGMTLLGAANDLITLFVALEILSIALYVMCALARRDRRSQESGIKYFVVGSVASAILLYGLALLYIATGSVDIPTIGSAVGLVTTPQRVAVLGLGLVTVGIGFKVAMAPFQLWTPDVYQGAPTNVTAFMAAATKAAGFAAVLRLYIGAFDRLADLWVPLIAALATLSMLYGAFAALMQRDVKRILAYSSIAHAGYALIGVVAGGQRGLSATLWYLLTYAVTTVAAFGAVVALERRRRGEVVLADLRGLGKTSPILAGILSLAMLSLAGIPPTAGFAGKLAVFEAGINADYTWLVVVGVASSVIAAFYYLRIMGMMFLEEPAEGTEPLAVSTGLSFGVSVSAMLVLFLGIQPGWLLDLAEKTAILAR